MIPPNSSDCSRPNFFHRKKRPCDDLSPASLCPSKRTRMDPELRKYSEVHQHVLLAAAKTLGVPIEQLLSLAASSNLSSTSNVSSRPDSVDVFSRSSSDDHTDDITPPEDPEHDNEFDSFDFSGTEKLQRPSATNAIWDSRCADSRTHANYGVEFSQDQCEKETNRNFAEDLFAPPEPPQTAPISREYYGASNSDNFSSTGDLRHMYSPSTYSLSSYPVDCTTNDPYITPPLSSSATEFETFPPTYPEVFSGHIVQNIPSSRGQVLSNADWIVSTQWSDGPSMGPFVPMSDLQEDLFRNAKEIGSGKGKRRGPFRVDEQRQETGLTRRIGACIRCSIARVRCIPDPLDETGCCRTCTKTPLKIPRLPCLRYKITDTELLDHEVCPRQAWTTRWKRMEVIDITNWDNDDIKSIDITQDVGNTHFTLQVRKFRPVEGDALSRKWKSNGAEYSYECAPYAIADMKEAGKTMFQFAQSNLKTAIRFWIDENDPLLRSTYNMAYNYSTSAEREEDRKLLSATLRMWSASRMMSRSDYICGRETLGMRRHDFGPNSVNTGKILTPPVFSAQMEVIFVAEMLLPTKREILERLKNLVYERNRRSWLAIYLCIFLLLHSCALLTKKDHERAKKQGLNQRFYRPQVIAELHNGAKVILAYFHFCNRGDYPLHMDWHSENQTKLTGLNAQQIEFMRQTKRDAEKKVVHFHTILQNGSYEDEYYFLAQLWERDWKPRHTI